MAQARHRYASPHLLFTPTHPLHSQRACRPLHPGNEARARRRGALPSHPPYPHSPIRTQIVLETEHDNAAALALYESLGFIREKRLHRFYLNGKDAFRLVLAVPDSDPDASDSPYASDGTPPEHPGRFFAYHRRHRAASHRAICVSPYSDEEDDEPSSR